MDGDGLPTKKQLVEELSKLTRRGLGRSLPGRQSEDTVKGLSEISLELADEPSEDWPMRIARVVIEEVRAIEPPEDRLALADVLAIDLERPLEEVLNSSEPIDPLESSGAQLGRYDRAASRYKPPMTERHFKERRRTALVERLSERLLARLKQRREKADDEPSLAAISDEPAVPPAERRQTEPPTMLIGAIGLLLMLIGVAWLIAVATGAIS
jgi:hypothetical protein